MVGKLSSIKLLEYKYFSSHSTLDDHLREFFFFFQSENSSIETGWRPKMHDLPYKYLIHWGGIWECFDLHSMGSPRIFVAKSWKFYVAWCSNHSVLGHRQRMDVPYDNVELVALLIPKYVEADLFCTPEGSLEMCGTVSGIPGSIHCEN